MSKSRHQLASTPSKGIEPGKRLVDDPWNELMVAAQKGDDRAYEQLMGELREWLSRYFRKRLTWAAAEDATQEALLAIHIYKPRYQAKAPLKPWLSTIARFKWIDQLRADLRRPAKLEEADMAVDDHGQAARAAILLELLLSETKPAQAQVVRLVKLNGASVDEAASLTGQSPSLVKVNIHRVLRRFEQAISD